MAKLYFEIVTKLNLQKKAVLIFWGYARIWIFTTLIKGVAAFLLGLLALEDGSDEVVTSVRKRPGPDAFLEALAGVGKSQSYATAAGNACPSAVDGDDARIFHAFTGIYRQYEAAISRHVAQFEDVRAEMAEKRQNIEKIRLLTSQIADYDQIREELTQLRGQLEMVQSENARLTEELANQKPSGPLLPPGLSEEEIRAQIEDQLRPEIQQKLESDLTPQIQEKVRTELTTRLEAEIRADLEENVLVALEDELRQKIEEEFKDQNRTAAEPEPPHDGAVTELTNQIVALESQIKMTNDENVHLNAQLNSLTDELNSKRISTEELNSQMETKMAENSKLVQQVEHERQQFQQQMQNVKLVQQQPEFKSYDL